VFFNENYYTRLCFLAQSTISCNFIFTKGELSKFLGKKNVTGITENVNTKLPEGAPKLTNH